jgi:hypothetical protein
VVPEIAGTYVVETGLVPTLNLILLEFNKLNLRTAQHLTHH